MLFRRGSGQVADKSKQNLDQKCQVRIIALSNSGTNNTSHKSWPKFFKKYTYINLVDSCFDIFMD